MPTSISGYSLCGQTLVRSNGLYGTLEASASGMICTASFQRGKSPVSLFGVELDCAAADIAFGVGRPALAGDGRKAHEDVGLLADLGEQRRPRVPADVVGDGEGAEGARALGVHAALGDHFAREVG